jgi:hypothetical protein
MVDSEDKSGYTTYSIHRVSRQVFALFPHGSNPVFRKFLSRTALLREISGGEFVFLWILVLFAPDALGSSRRVLVSPGSFEVGSCIAFNVCGLR